MLFNRFLDGGIAAFPTVSVVPVVLLQRELEGTRNRMDVSNLPGDGQVFLDHVGHFVPDAGACATALDAAGFTVTPFSAQMAPDPDTGRPALTGTGNVCVMLRSGYLEFLTHTADTPIGLEFKEALARRAGLHLAAFAVPDAEARHGDLSRRLPMRPLVRFSRDVEAPEGSREARFTVARLHRDAMPEGRVQLLTHASERAMWQARWLDHPNGAEGLVSLIASAPDPAGAAARFSAFLDRPVIRESGTRYRMDLDRGGIEFLNEDAAARLLGAAIEPGRPNFVGYAVSVGDLSRTRAHVERAGLPVHAADASTIVVPFPPALGLGTWVFAESPTDG